MFLRYSAVDNPDDDVFTAKPEIRSQPAARIRQSQERRAVGGLDMPEMIFPDSDDTAAGFQLCGLLLVQAHGEAVESVTVAIKLAVIRTNLVEQLIVGVFQPVDIGADFRCFCIEAKATAMAAPALAGQASRCGRRSQLDDYRPGRMASLRCPDLLRRGRYPVRTQTLFVTMSPTTAAGPTAR